LEVHGPDQLWVADLTYVAIATGHFYFREAIRIAAAMALRMTARPVA
jgi:transposase InsO family protein